MQPLNLLITATLIVMPVTGAHAQMNMDQMKMDQPAGKSGETHKATGVVKSVDRTKGTVTLDHEPVKSMNWSAMTMSFTVKDKDKATLDKLQSGKKVEVEFVQQGKEYV